MAHVPSFGLNFYGYFVFAALWVCGYFFWAWRINARERRKTSQRAQSRKLDDETHRHPESI